MESRTESISSRNGDSEMFHVAYSKKEEVSFTLAGVMSLSGLGLDLALAQRDVYFESVKCHFADHRAKQQQNPF